MPTTKIWSHISGVMVSVLASSVVDCGLNHINGVMVSVLASSVVECGFESRSGQTKDYSKIGIYCFSAKHAALRRNSKDWLAWNQEKVGRHHVYARTVVSVS